MEKTPPGKVKKLSNGRLPVPRAKYGKNIKSITFTKVEGRRKLQKGRRLDALLITKIGDLSYADIMRKSKTDTSLTSLGESVDRIR